MSLDSVTKLPIKNTHCIICGEPFDIKRASKLYCSSSCRQSAYYHKEKIADFHLNVSKGINKEVKTLSIQDYTSYNETRVNILAYKKLQNDFRHIEEGTHEWEMLYNNPRCALTKNRTNIPEQLIELKLPQLSIEQWSCIKILYPNFSSVNFALFVSSLSSEFLNQIRFDSASAADQTTGNFLPVKNMYLCHLQKIVNGEIQFNYG